MVVQNGRSISVPFVDSSLNGTSFQCFIPSSSGSDLISSPIGVLTVRENGKSHALPLDQIRHSSLNRSFSNDKLSASKISSRPPEVPFYS